MTDYADLALAQFRTRQANARRMVKAGEIPLAQAEAAMRPWASLALRAGAELPELAPERTGFAVWQVTPPGAVPPETVRAMLAEEVCPIERCRHALRAARDKAIDRGDWEAASPLIRLGERFGPLPPYVPADLRPERKAA